MIGLSSAARRVGRALTVSLVVAPLSVAMVLVTPATSQAASSFQGSTPSSGAVLTTNSFTVDANVDARSAATTLTVTGTDADGTQVCKVARTSEGGRLSAQRLVVSFPSSSTCSTTRNARWMATLSGGATSTRGFATNAAPAEPASFDAQGSGAREVTFTWTRGDEQDLTGYVLYDDGGVVDDSIALSNCNGDTCSYGIYYPADKPGTYSYQLAARRAAAGCGSCEASFVESGRSSSSATLVLPPPPPPTPSPTPSPTPTGGSSTGGTTGGSTSGGGTTGGGTTGGTAGGGGAPGGTAGSGSGGTTVTPSTPSLPRLNTAAIQRRAFALQFSAFAPSLKIPKLPPLPANFAAPQLAEAPLPDGTFDPKLDYGTRTEVVKETTVLSQFRDVAAVDTDDLAKGLAAGLILLLLAAHVRRFVSVKPDL